MAFDLHSLIKKFNPDPSKAGKTLLILNALGMVFAAASNTVAAATDKNTSAEDKKFLVPAGAITGAANIGIYFALTEKLINKLQGTKKVKGIADAALEQMSDKEIKNNTLAFVQKSIKKAEKGFLGTGLFKKSDEYVASMKSTLLNKENLPTSEAIKEYKSNLKAGTGVLGAFIGAVAGCAILTPVIRDVSAYFVQKHMEKNNPDLEKESYRPYFDPVHVRRYGNVGKHPLSMKSYMAFTNGRMKV